MRWLAIIFAMLLGAWAQPALAAPTVGMEGQIEIELPGSLLEARPVTEKAPLLLRVASVTPRHGGQLYDLRYIGLVPGKHDLRDYLVRSDGSAIDDLPAIPVNVGHLLPEEHDGALAAVAQGGTPFFGGYRYAAIAAAVVWLGLLVPLILVGRKRRRAAIAAPPPAPPSFADRLRPLIEQAAAGRLSIDDKCRIERLLLWYWRARLELTEEDPALAIAHLHAHPQAGALLRAMEQWLHRRPGETEVDVAALLAPYRDMPDPADDRGPLVAAAEGGAS